MENERTCDVCGETGDTTCFNGSGICADENNVNVYETVMAMRDACITNERAYYDDHSDAHLKRYITNRNRRTGETWDVVERYATNGNGIRCAVDGDNAEWGYQRAIIANEHGERVRIWYYGPYWRVA